MALVLRREWWGRAGFGDGMTAFGAFGGAGSDTLRPGEALQQGQSLRSNDGRFIALMQYDGNFVVYSNAWIVEPNNAHGAPVLWASGTNGKGGTRIVMQSDGNLVIYGGSGAGGMFSGGVVWAANTAGKGGTSLQLQDNGNLVITHPVRSPWATNRTAPGAPYPPAAPPPAPVYTPPTSTPATTPVAVPTGPDRQQLADRFNSARQRAIAAADAYNKAVAQANRAIAAAKRRGAPDAVAHANQAAALVPAVHDKAQASIEAANAYGKQQGFAGLRGFEGYAWAYGDLVDDAGSAADQATSILGQIQSHADQAELADSNYSPPAAGPAPTTPVPEQIAAEQVAPTSPAPTPMSISSPGSSVSVSVSPSGEAIVSGEPPITKVLLYGGLAALALLLLKGGRSNG